MQIQVSKRKRAKMLEEGFKLLIEGLICLISFPFIYSLTHESGHFLAAVSFGWQVKEIHVSLFPFSLDFSTFITLETSLANVPEYQKIIYTSAGSLNSLSWGIILFSLFYFNKTRFLKRTCAFYSLLLSYETMVYILMDILSLQFGDWWRLIHAYPLYVLSIFICTGLYDFIITIKIIKKCS
jgi:hypothetical protein